ncbi:hypothetical protein GOBAR_DD17230 [Gossypium barbadense]|nr:hypothetical protein GOBAR_DD17230 [Gossypium barbadense]
MERALTLLSTMWFFRNRLCWKNEQSTASQHWSRPAAGWLKCNTETICFHETGNMGLAALLREDHGVFIHGMQCQIEYLVEPRIAEAMSIKEALSWLKDLQKGF